MFRFGVNSCLLYAFCVLMVATAVNCASRQDLSCKPGSRWKNECNSCFCGEDGTFAACTLIGCIKLREDAEFPGPECYEAAEWKKKEYKNGVFTNSCLWCKCQNEKAICNPIACGSNF